MNRKKPIVHELRNGLKVLMKPTHSAPLVSVWCWYKVGSSDERPGITGVSHWLEHMLFKGTKKYSKEEMKSLVEKRGGYWNGYTWIDQTTYFETLPKDHLDFALELESERMAYSLIDRREFDSERTVILAELRGGENNPESLLDREVTAATFQAHGYHWPTIGWEEDVKRITHDEMLGHYERWYNPSNATLVVAGDFDPGATLRKVRKHFGRIPKGMKRPQERTVEAPQLGEKRVTVEGSGTTSYYHAAFRAPAVSDPRFYALVVLDAVLGGAKGISLWSSGSEATKSSPLNQALVEKRLATAARSFTVPTRDPYLYYFTVTLAHGVTTDRVEKSLFRLLNRAAAKAPTKRELEKAKNQIRAAHVFQSDSVTEVAHNLGYFETIDSYEFLDTFLDRVQAVTAEEVRALAETLFVSKNRTVGIYAPEKVRRGRRA
ncbi:MAG: insulinase family protein, partial [Gemmatimonadetes bacterium]|nr:insulinase family protein [Gemmatimonadota bacterium]